MSQLVFISRISLMTPRHFFLHETIQTEVIKCCVQVLNTSAFAFKDKNVGRDADLS